MDEHVVMKLKKKLGDAVYQKEEEYVLKLLHKLSQVPMTLAILQSTQIGKDVNNLRKMSRRIKEESKTLVQTWKRLLPPSEPSKPSQDRAEKNNPALESSTSSIQQTDYSSTEHGREIPSSQTGGDGTNSNYSSRPPRSKGSKARHSETGVHSSKSTSSKGSKSLDDFSKAMLGTPCSHSNESAEVDSGFHDQESSHRTVQMTHKGTRREAHIRKQHQETYTSAEIRTNERLESKSATISNHSNIEGAHTANSTSDDYRSSSNHGSSGSHSTTDDPTRKRKAEVGGSLDGVSLSKRSRTQVYSGKKSDSGPKTVTPLFDLCMKVLIDNIEAIEEVGGVPFYVLEPVLSKCSPTQLMRLEEFNQHFIEDSDGLWEKHCGKEFKGAIPRDDQTWRDLYVDRLELRELKLKSLAARISATEKARKEPIRQVKSTVATRKPGRRGAGQVFHPGMASRPLKPLEKTSSARSLMSKTMKMAKERNHMMRSKPSHR